MRKLLFSLCTIGLFVFCSQETIAQHRKASLQLGTAIFKDDFDEIITVNRLGIGLEFWKSSNWGFQTGVAFNPQGGLMWVPGIVRAKLPIWSVPVYVNFGAEFNVDFGRQKVVANPGVGLGTKYDINDHFGINLDYRLHLFPIIRAYHPFQETYNHKSHVFTFGLYYRWGHTF